MRQSGFFDVEERLARLSVLGDQLEAFSRTVDFEVFCPDLEKALAYSDGSKCGRPRFDLVLMFKILVIQTLNNLSDERTEYLINDRLSFMRFLGSGLSDRVPDAKTVWLFRKRLTQTGAIERLFDRFDATLRNAGYLPMSGQILDATLVAAPKLRNTNTEKVVLWAGRIPEDWQDKPAKLSHKDRHARWTLKVTKAKWQDDGTIPPTDLAIPFFGYKSHVFIDRKFRFIQKSNAGKSVIRSRVEHVFADQQSQTGLFIRTIGTTRTTMRIRLANIVYNMRRFLFLERIDASA
ncbi:transposase [Gluconobacter cerinus]|uniref:transposase n=1 Tax=Gluconobacter cerinus TaxID=38307 RepID=UPI001B8BE9C1|nr:transposase [Gluconobacter cerinus]MBS1035265.1 transposase [Gluconobacter cerinus]